MAKHTILLLYGGESSEHDVSVASAHNIYAALDDEKYHVLLCYIDKLGRWWLTDSVDGSHVGKPQLLPVFGQKQFVTLPGNHIVHPDVIFPVLHGKNGEDGTVQSVARLLHVPCVGPSVSGAAISMDKDVTKQLLASEKIPVVPWLVWNSSEPKPDFSEVKAKLGVPLFVKPANAGSSVGVSKVTKASQWLEALEQAGAHDRAVLVEKGIDAREVELAVLGNETPKVSGAGEIVPGDEFYSYDDKYSSTSSSRVQIPAELPDDMLGRLQALSLQAYRVTHGRGMARVDFFIDKKTNEVYLNEINSIPGFTSISMYPKLWRASGMSYGQLVDELIALALASGV